MRFYVYEHWRPDKDTCFWVGKGKGRRAYLFRRNGRYDRVVAKLARLGMCVEVRLVAEALSESEAFRIERERIAFWRDQGDELCNMTDGGEGVEGWRHPPLVRARMSAKATGRIPSEITRAKMSAARLGRKASAEARARLSAAKMGKPQGPHTPEHNAKIGAASRGRKDSAETRAKKREAALRREPLAETARRQVAESVTVLWTDPDYRARMKAAHAARPAISDETRAKMRAAQQARRKAELEGAR